MSWLWLVVIACDAGAPPVKQAPPPVGSAVIAAPDPEAAPRPPVPGDLERYAQSLGGTNALVAEIVTSEGTLHCDLFPDTAPLTVANFIGLATGQKVWRNPLTNSVERGKRFYDGLSMHRVIPDFVIQGGDPVGNGTGGPGYQFKNEISQQHEMGPGALAMANAGDNTNGSQFFVMEGGSRPDLTAHYTIFGQCHELEVVKRIARVPRDTYDKPIARVTIVRVTFAHDPHYGDP